DEFKNASGLAPSLPKSTAYFCNVLNYVKIGILAVLPFEEEKLPVKYLGAPLVPLFCGKSPACSFSEMKKGKAKVAWEVVCLSKKEGGLGIRRLDIFNKALISSHIGSSFSDTPSHGNMSWG
ncbi:hypothetical protein Tco_1250128, partial [Tanacetum coccineum]